MSSANASVNVSSVCGGGVGNVCPQFCRATHMELYGNRLVAFHLSNRELFNGRTVFISLLYTRAVLQ